MNNQVLNLDASLVEKAKAADNAALEGFHAKVVKLSQVFSIKETARLMRVSTGYLRTHSEKRGITFADRDSRTPAQKREVKKLWDYYLIHYDIRQVEAPVPPVQPGDLSISPGLELESRKQWFSARNVFFERCCELAELFTILEAAEILKVSHRFLKNFAYNEQVTFVGEPSLDVKNEFYARAEKIACATTPIEQAARALNVTTRFLTGYAKNWELPFAFPPAAAECNEGEVDTTFMEDLCLDDDSDEETTIAGAEADDEGSASSFPHFYDQPVRKVVGGSAYAQF